MALIEKFLYLRRLRERKYIEGKSFVASANKNEVPRKILGRPKKLRELLTSLNLADRPILDKYGVNNGICYVVEVNQDYYLLLYGTPNDKEELDSIISRCQLVKKIPRNDLKRELRTLFGL